MVFACAESCTGGLLAHQMTVPAGSSEVFWGAAVTYANEAKTRMLGVSSGLLSDHGAVSGPVAEAMVTGLLAVSGVPLAVSITGVAGPAGGTEAKPVGTVWFGLGATKQGTTRFATVRVQCVGTRGQIQRQAAAWARRLATCWWDSDMALDSLRSLTDNNGRSSLEAFQTPAPLFPHPL